MIVVRVWFVVKQDAWVLIFSGQLSVALFSWEMTSLREKAAGLLSERGGEETSREVTRVRFLHRQTKNWINSLYFPYQKADFLFKKSPQTCDCEKKSLRSVFGGQRASKYATVPSSWRRRRKKKKRQLFLSPNPTPPFFVWLMATFPPSLLPLHRRRPFLSAAQPTDQGEESVVLLVPVGGDYFLISHVQFFGVWKGKNFVSKRGVQRQKTLSPKGCEKAKTLSQNGCV